jgi:ribosomal protein S27AE
MKLLASDKHLREAQFGDGGPVIKQGKDGTFTVPDHIGKRMVRSGEWGKVGINFRNVKGYRCECGFLAVFSDRCGKCGSTDLTEE